jgi:hypothetical protein
MPNPFYETSDHYLASFLLSQGVRLIAAERVSARRTVLRFAATELMHELLRLYWRQVEIPLVPIRLFAAHRKVKSLVRLDPADPRPAEAQPGLPGGTSRTPSHRDNA